MPDAHQALARNSILQIAGRLLGTALGLVTFYVLLHAIGVSGYGRLQVALTFTSLFAIVVDFGLTLTTAQMISEEGADEKSILGNLFALRTLSAFIFLSIAPLASFALPYGNDIRLAVLGTAVASFFASVAQMFIGVFQRRLEIARAVVAEFGNRVLVLLSVLLLASIHAGVAAMAFAFAVGGFVQFLVMLFGVHKRVPLSLRFDGAVWKSILVRSWPIGASIVFNLIYLKGDVFFLSLFHVSDFDIGQYGAAYKVVDVLTSIPVMVMGLLLPIMALAWSKNDENAVRGRVQIAFDVFAIVAVPFAVGAYMLGVPLMTFVKPDLVTAGLLLRVLGPAVSIVFFGTLFGHAVVAVNKQRTMLFAYVAVAVASIWAYAAFIPRFGVWAAAWVTFGSELLVTVCGAALVLGVLKFVPSPALAVRALAATVIMALVIAFAPSPHILVTIALGVVVYVLSLAAFGGPTPRNVIKLFV